MREHIIIEDSWVEYVKDLGNLNGITAVPTFSAAYQAMGKQGITVLGITMLGGIFSSLAGRNDIRFITANKI